MKYTYSQLKDGYTPLWKDLVVIKEKDARSEASKIVRYKSIYKDLEAKTGVPWFCIGIIHTREAGSVDVGRWQCALHNGERIVGTGRRTKLVPSGRGPFATFADAAVDALSGYKGQAWSVELLAYTLEKFNGFGYRGHGIPSPYLWGGTNKQKRGKYVSDGQYDPSVMDPQIGGMALLMELMALDSSVSFETSSQPLPAPRKDGSETAPSLPPASPQKPVSPSIPRSKASLWATLTAPVVAAVAYLKEHRMMIILTVMALSALALISFIVWKKFIQHRMWTNPSPKAEAQEADVADAKPSVSDSDVVVQADAVPEGDKKTTSDDVKQ